MDYIWLLEGTYKIISAQLLFKCCFLFFIAATVSTELSNQTCGENDFMCENRKNIMY